MPHDALHQEPYYDLDQLEPPEAETDRFLHRRQRAGELELDPAFTTILGAAFRTENTVVSHFANSTGPKHAPVEGYDPFEVDGEGKTDVAGYEDYLDAFVPSRSPDETMQVKRKIDSQKADRAILAEGGALGIISSVAAGVTSPENLALMAVALPAAAATRAAAAARTAAIGVAAVGAQEALLHADQPTRTASDTLTALAATAILDGTLGAAFFRRLPSEQQFQLAVETEARLNGGMSVGAAEAASASGNRMADVTPLFRYTGLGHVGRFMQRFTPGGRTMQNQHQEIRALGQDLFEIHVRIQDDTLPPAAETLVNVDKAKASQVVMEGRKLQKESGLDPRTFNAYLDDAMRNGDVHANPHVQKLAKQLRSEIYDPWWQAAAKAKIPGAFEEVVDPVTGTVSFKPVETKTAVSYLARRYDIHKVRTNKPAFTAGWRRGIEDRLRREAEEAERGLRDMGVTPVSASEPPRVGTLRVTGGREAPSPSGLRGVISERGATARPLHQVAGDELDALRAKYEEVLARPALEETDWAEILEDIYQKVINLRKGDIHADVGPGKGSMFKARADVGDEFLQDFLVKDWERLAGDYVGVLSPRVRLAEKYGDWQMNDAMDGVQERTLAAVEGADQATRMKAEEALRKGLADIVGMRNRLLGQTSEMTIDPNLAATLRTARSFNSARMLGSTMLTSIPEMARYMTYAGLAPYARGLAKAIKDLKLTSVPKADLARLSSAISRVESQRLQIMTEVDPAVGGRIERGAEWIAHKAWTASGMRHFDALNRTLGGYLVGDKITRSVLKGRGKGKLKQLGFSDQHQARLLAQMERHAVKEDGLWTPRIDLWDDAEMVGMMEAAVVKDVGQLTPLPGIGDTPLFMDNQLFRTLFQFKSFMLGSLNRITMPAMQEGGTRPWVMIMGMTGMGMLSYAAKTASSGQEFKTDPLELLLEGIDRGGVAAYGMELYNLEEKLLSHGGGGTARYLSRGWLGAFAGPTFGDLIDSGRALVGGAAGPDARMRAARRLLPFQNHFMLRYGLDEIEAETAKMLGGKGTATERGLRGRDVQTVVEQAVKF